MVLNYILAGCLWIGFVTSVIGKAGNCRAGWGGGGRRESWGTRNLTSRIRRRWKCSHGVLFVSEEWWVVSTGESLCRNLWEWLKKTRVDEPDSGEWYFPLSERLEQDRSWWANKMVEQKKPLLLVMKTRLYKDRTSVYCWLVWFTPQAPYLLKMPA